MKPTAPVTFEARIGGHLGWSFSASLTDNGLEYVEYAEEYTPMAAKILVPSPARWRALRQTLDRLSVWSWNAEYLNPHVRDGTSWEFECEWGDRAIRTGGSNAFPSDPDPRKATHSQNESRRFDAFLRAISQLLGGAPFE